MLKGHCLLVSSSPPPKKKRGKYRNMWCLVKILANSSYRSSGLAGLHHLAGWQQAGLCSVATTSTWWMLRPELTSSKWGQSCSVPFLVPLTLHLPHTWEDPLSQLGSHRHKVSPTHVPVPELLCVTLSWGAEPQDQPRRGHPICFLLSLMGLFSLSLKSIWLCLLVSIN